MEVGTIVSAKDIEEEGLCSDDHTAVSGESGTGEFSSGESGGVQAGRGYWEAMGRCENCQAKHYGCLFVLLKESGGGRGGASGSQKAKVAEGSQIKGQARKARKTITLGKSIATEVSSSLKCIVEPGKSKVIMCVQAASAVGVLCMSQEALWRSIDALHAQLDTYDLEVWSILHRNQKNTEKIYISCA